MKPSTSSLVGALTMFIVVSIVYGMWYMRVADESVEVFRLQNDLSSKNDLVHRISAARATLQKNDDPTHNLSKYFIDKTEVASFISTLERTAKKNGASLEVVAVSTDIIKASPTLSFTLGVEGSFNELMQTLGAIEYAPYHISFSGVMLTKNEKLWQAEVKMLVSSTQ